jgi:hypothetical protein
VDSISRLTAGFRQCRSTIVKRLPLRRQVDQRAQPTIVRVPRRDIVAMLS